MNFSQAVRGQLTTSGAINAIQSQAETELGRNLSREEESNSLVWTDSEVWLWLLEVPVVFEEET